MLPKHKKIIENHVLNGDMANSRYLYEANEDTLNICLDKKTFIQNCEIDNISTWNVKEGSKDSKILINKMNNLDVVALIVIADNETNTVYATIKQTPTDLYVYCNDKVIRYDINNCNADTLINIMEDYFNKNNMLKNNSDVVLSIIKTDINEIFALMYNNKQDYLDNLEYNLNIINAKYLMDSEKVKKMIRTVNKYSSND